MNLDKYRINVSTIQGILEHKTDAERLSMLGRVSIMTSVPIIVVAMFMKELYGDIPGLDKKLIALMKFYDVKSVT
jgi:hypothetical protein